MNEKLKTLGQSIVLALMAGVLVYIAATYGSTHIAAATGSFIVLLLIIFADKLSSGTTLSALTKQIVDARDKDLKIPEPEYANTPYRDLVKALNSYGEGVNEVVGQAANRSNGIVLVSKMLAEASKGVSNHADEQAARTGELATAMEQMSATIQEIARGASHTQEVSVRMTDSNQEGMQQMESVANSVSQMSDIFDRVLHVMEDLRAASGDIGNVVKVISDIAEQTNLLALNAAIEAARAGEQGRGFAVVADEVRTLAERTKESTKEINETIERNQSLTEEVATATADAKETVNQGVEQTQVTLDSLNAVKNDIEEVNGLIHQIASATEQQSTTVNDITSNIEKVSRLSQETFVSAKGSYQASTGLEEFANELETRVCHFNLDFMGLVPVENGIDMNNSFAGLCGYISSVLGRKLFIRLGHDYDDAIADVGQGRALVSFQTPSTYIEAHEKFGVVPLVVPLAKGEPFYKSAIIVRDDSGIDSVSDLRGIRFAFGDAKSTGSKAMPESMLKAAGIGLDVLAEYGFLGSHDNVAKAVLNKNFEAGGLMASAAEKYLSEGLKILEVSAPIPQFPLCASPKMSAEDRERVIEALVNLNDETILGALSGGVTGFARIEDSDYDGVREMLRNLKS